VGADDSDADSGCNCSVPKRTSRSSTLILGLALGALLVRRQHVR
jgi:hypothetical protein